MRKVYQFYKKSRFIRGAWLRDGRREERKFEEYYNLVYNNNLEYRYDTLWKKNIVFFPRIIHQTGPTDLNRWLNIWKLCQQTWKNNFPDWEYKFWSDQDIEDIVKNDYPSLYQIYKRYN